MDQVILASLRRKSESWKRDRALKNLFTADDVPPAISEAEQEGEQPAGT